MSKLGISTGTSPNDGTGDSLSSGAVKINSNFTEVYSAIGDGSNINIGIGKTVITTTLTGNVGIGSTIPAAKLDIGGNVAVSGVTTTGSLNIGATEVISAARQLKNISSLDATTIATIESAVANSPNTFTDLNITGISTLGITSVSELLVTGVSTFSGITTVSGVTLFAKQLNVSGIGTISTLNSTSGTITNLTGTIGTITSTINVGTGGTIISTSGIGSIGIGTANPARKIHIFGDASTNQFNAAISVNSTNTTGYGAYLGVNASSNTSGRDYRLISAGALDNPGVGKFSIYDVTASLDRFTISSSGNIGIASTNPTAQLHVVSLASTTQIVGLFSGTTSNDMVRITQLGTGNALVVEDSTNPDVSPFVVGAAGSVGIGTNDPSALLHLGGGTASAGTAPLKFSTGVNLTTPEAGVLEYDGSYIYATPGTVSGRGYIPVLRTYRLTADGSNIGAALTDFYGASAAINLNASAAYDIEFHTYFTKNTAGIATWTLTASSAPTLISGYYIAPPITGIATGQTNGAITNGYVAGRAVGITSFASTGSLSSGVNHSFIFKVQVITNAATTFKLQVFQTAGTMTPLAGSYYTVKRISDTTGSFA